MKYEADMMDQRRAGRAEGLEEGFGKGLAQGRAEGHEEGRTAGREEGHEEGLEEGRAVGLREGSSKRTLELCERMIRQDFTDGQIASLLEIPVEENCSRCRCFPYGRKFAAPEVQGLRMQIKSRLFGRDFQGGRIRMQKTKR